MLIRTALALGVLGVALHVAGTAAGAATKPGFCDVPKQYPTIQSAIDDPSCLTVHPSIGTFTEQLTISRSLTLAGTKFREWTTVIQAPATLAAPAAVIRIVGRRTRVKMKHLVIEGPGPADGLVGIRVERDAILHIRNTAIRAIRPEAMTAGGGFTGIHAGDGNTATAQITTLNVSETRIEDYQNAGIVVEGRGTVAAIASTLLDGGGERPETAAPPSGILARAGAKVTIGRSTVSDHRHPAGGGVGVLLDGVAVKTALTYNAIDRNDVGVRVANATGVSLYRNGLDGGGDGVVLEAVSTTLSRNRMANGSGAGVRLVGAVSSALQTNELMANAEGGLVVDAASAGNVMSGNRADTNGGWGFTDLSTGTRTSGTANTYRGNYCHGNALGDSSPAGLCR